MELPGAIAQLPGVLPNLACAGGAAVLTVTFIHPIDTVKTRLQVSGTAGARNYAALGLRGTVSSILKMEGPLAFWKGISAAWMREATYSSLRLGLYKPVKKLFRADQADSPFMLKFAAGGTTGALGSVAGNPFDMLKTKMMAGEARESVPLSKLIGDILKKQGLAGFYRGMDANIVRAFANNGTKMATYDVSKSALAEATGWDKASIPLQALASVVAGFFMTIAVAPFDISRTRLMNQPADKPQGPARVYYTIFDTLYKIVKHDGPLVLWRGFIPMWARIAPTTTLQLLFFEQFATLAGIQTT
ncbi:mitochondrial carrier domain-containing protein [Pelagophyceae sp. CCMP2097]|nr:mitochondrial carrier domain-containing protein [Pelagophyceae sp. CCMP2097]